MKTIHLINDDYKGHVERIRHACRGVVVRNTAVLLTYEAKENRYMLPGGGVEQGETYEDCCQRELLEETGMVVKPVQHFLTIEEHFDVLQHFNHFFVCELVE